MLRTGKRGKIYTGKILTQLFISCDQKVRNSSLQVSVLGVVGAHTGVSLLHLVGRSESELIFALSKLLTAGVATKQDILT